LLKGVDFLGKLDDNLIKGDPIKETVEKMQ